MLIKAGECGTESSSLEHGNSELLGQPMEQPWDLAALVNELDGSNWFCEVAEA